MVSVRSVARHGWVWWPLWIVMLAGIAALIGFLWHSDQTTADRISLLAVAMSVLGLVAAAAAAKWTREAVVVADKTLRIQTLSEDMERLETISDAVWDCALAKPGAAVSLAAAMGPFTAKDLPRTFELQQKCQNGDTPGEALVREAINEVRTQLNARRGARATEIQRRTT